MKKSAIAVIIGVLSVGVLFGGCSLFGGADPTLPAGDVVKEGLGNFYNVYSANYDLSINADVQGVEGQVPQNMNIEATLAGIFNLQSKENPNLSIVLTGSGSSDDKEAQDIAMEIRVNKSNFYGILSQVPDLGEEVPKEFLDSFSGKWWQIALPPETFDNVNFAPEDREANLSPEEKQMKELIDNTSFFKDIEYLGTEKVEGEQTYHYSATLDKEAVTAFVEEASKIDGGRISPEELQKFAEVLTSSEFDAELWVGVDDMTMRKIAGTFSMFDAVNGTAEIEFEFSVWNLNEELEIEIPEDAQEFDPTMFLGAAAMMQGGVTTDDSASVEAPSIDGLEIPAEAEESGVVPF